MLLAVVLLALAATCGAQRIRLPNLQYPRETDQTKWTALDRYVWTYDDTAGYQVYPKTYKGAGWTGYVLDFNSGTWKPEVSSRPLWQHWLTVCIPDKIIYPVATMYMDGPGNTQTPDSDLNPEIYMFCNGKTGGPTVYLEQVPNEDLSFPDHPGGIGEDALIAYGWRKFLNGSATDPTWLMRLPMTRAGSNAMTAVQDFFRRFHPEAMMPTGFLVSGASKRGWNTWTVAAVDSRVVAAVPIVMPIGQVVPNIAAEWRAYGNWSFALKDYIHFGIVNYLFATPGVQAIADIVDPVVYMDRYTMPVWNIIACGDEFTLPDSPRFWWSKLPGEKHLRAVPNAEHSMACCALDLVADIISFYQMLVNNVPRPTLDFQLTQAGASGQASITVNTPKNAVVHSVNMWWAVTGPQRRDFRLVTCFDLPKCFQPVVWLPHKLEPSRTSSSNTTVTYVATQSAPASGWTGFLVQVDFIVPVPGFGNVSWRVSSEVNVVPDTFPFPACPASECNSPGKI